MPAKPTTEAAPKPSAEHETSDLPPKSAKATEGYDSLSTSPEDNDSPINNILKEKNCWNLFDLLVCPSPCVYSTPGVLVRLQNKNTSTRRSPEPVRNLQRFRSGFTQERH